MTARLSRRAAAALLAIGLVALGACDDRQMAPVDDAWVRPLPPGRSMTAGYLELVNDSSTAWRLTGVESSLFERVEIHQSEVVDGVNRMRRVDGLDIGPGERLTLAPGGLHLMLIGPDAAVADATAIPLTLRFDGRSPLTVSAAVRQRANTGH